MNFPEAFWTYLHHHATELLRSFNLADVEAVEYIEVRCSPAALVLLADRISEIGKVKVLGVPLRMVEAPPIGTYHHAPVPVVELSAKGRDLQGLAHVSVRQVIQAWNRMVV